MFTKCQAVPRHTGLILTQCHPVQLSKGSDGQCHHDHFHFTDKETKPGEGD